MEISATCSATPWKPIPHPPPPRSVPAALSRVLGDPRRWAILRELAKGEPLPIYLLASIIRISESSTSKHMAVIRNAGVAISGLGNLYTLAPAYRADPETQEIDFGHCVVRPSPPKNPPGGSTIS